MNAQSIEPANRTFVRAASLTAIPEGASLTVNLDGHVIALFHTPEGIFAVDNRCPHMGFPLDRGTVKDCILTCHWHHARFDLHSGGAFDPWADDVRAFPVKVEGGDIWIDLAPRGDLRRHRVERLRDGIERNLPLVIGKSVIAMLAPPPGSGRISNRGGCPSESLATEHSPWNIARARSSERKRGSRFIMQVRVVRPASQPSRR